jgi:hypothetical protein
MAMVRNIDIMLDKAEPLCVEFCNFVYLCKLFNFLVLNFIQLFSFGMITHNSEPPILFHGVFIYKRRFEY